MDTQITATYHLVIRGDEFRLLSKALRGILSDEDKPKALELQIKMLQDKHAWLKQQMESSQKNIDNIEAASIEGK